jgi:hypothetical protein
VTSRVAIPAKAPLHRQHKPGKMNKTEAAYSRHLILQQSIGVVHQWWFEAFKFRVAYDACWITIDFLVQLPDGTIELHDVKGGPTEEDAAIKEKVLVTLFPFRVLEVRKKKGTGLVDEWDIKEI